MTKKTFWRNIINHPFFVIIIFIAIIILVLNFVKPSFEGSFGGSETYREHTAKRRLGESGSKYVKWGDKIHLQNQQQNGYLDVCGKCSDNAKCSCPDSNKQDVATDPSETRDNKSGTWEFEKDNSNNIDYPEYIVYGDLVNVYSMHQKGNRPSYLSICKDRDQRGGCNKVARRCSCPQGRGVWDVISGEKSDTTYGIWKIISSIGISDGHFVEYGADIYLENQLQTPNYFENRTFLNVCGKCSNDGNTTDKCAGSACTKGTRFDVSTSHTPTWEGYSGTWKIIQADD